MMAALLTSSSVLMCPHGGTVSVVTSNTQVKAAGDFVLRQSDTFLVAGCPFTIPPGVPHPCVQVQWVEAALQTQAAGDFALTEESVGLCVAADQAVQGSVLICFAQPQASGQ
jgi:hypothetical protein